MPVACSRFVDGNLAWIPTGSSLAHLATPVCKVGGSGRIGPREDVEEPTRERSKASSENLRRCFGHALDMLLFSMTCNRAAKSARSGWPEERANEEDPN